VRALDRVLLSGDYVIPLFHLPRQWVAHWRELKRPATTPLYGYQIDTWWIDLLGHGGDQQRREHALSEVRPLA